MIMEAEASKTVLLVDDEQSHLESLERIFQREGYHTLCAGSGQAALELLRQHHVHVMLTDLVMPGMSGSELLKACRTVSPETEVVMMTAYGTIETAVEAMKDGAYDFITKPLKKVFITKVVRRALEKQKLMLENRTLREQLESMRPHDIIGQSPAIVETLTTIRQAGPSSATVLLSGESGTGKELLARAIHRASPRSEHAFVAVNCAALPEGILESELFGYERGAFTGADRRREGRFEAAHQGTLFLDEVGEMNPSTQVKLLRILQDGEFERLGSNETLKVDLRLVAATNQDLEQAVAGGKFREDLYYRLNVIHVRVPPLRERSGDVPLLANFFLRRYAKKNDKVVEGVTARAMDAMGNYSWPGNVRELENVIERAVVLSGDAIIDLDDLPQNLTGLSSLDSDKAMEGRGVYVPVGTSMENAERMLLRETLKATGGDKNLAAKLLGVATRTIYRKLGSKDKDKPDKP
jgi:two-component system response regulator HydG